MKKSLSKNILVILLVTLISFSIYTIIPILIKKFSFLNHIIIAFYLEQLKHIILLLPVAVILYFIAPLRKILDYKNPIMKIKEPHFLIGIVLLSLLAANLISWKCYNHYPKEDDTAVYKQAQIFLTGKRWVPSQVYPEFFDGFNMINNNGRFFSMPAPGHPFLLLLGFLIKAPWIICPLIGALLLLVLYFLLKNLYTPFTARTGAVFLLLSPAFLFFSASFLNQNSSTLFSLLGLFLIIKLFNKKSQWYLALLSGFVISIAFLSRPTLPFAFFLSSLIFIIIMEHKKQLNKGMAVLFVTGFLPLLVFQLYDNFTLTGHPLHYGYSLCEFAKLNIAGFGTDIGSLSVNMEGHSLLKAIVNLMYNVFTISLHLFGWPLLSLVFVALWICKSKKTGFEWIFMGIIGLSIIFMGFFWAHGNTPTGPHYYYEIIPLLVIITAVKLESLAKPNIRAVVTLLFLIGIFSYIPNATKVFKVWGTNNNCYNEVTNRNIHNAIVFIKDPVGSDEKTVTLRRYNYLSVICRNDAIIENSDILYAEDLESKNNAKLIKLYTNRKIYLFEYLNNGNNWQVVPYTH
ncbi:MAG: glycosyltransferase family 39 protein [bacterium]